MNLDLFQSPLGRRRLLVLAMVWLVLWLCLQSLAWVSGNRLRATQGAVNDALAQLNQLSALPNGSAGANALLHPDPASIERSLREHGIAKVDAIADSAHPHDVSVRLEEIDFNVFLTWLNAFTADGGRLLNAEVDAIPSKPGVVSIAISVATD